ncbi:DUF4817 domain-containing protein [Nephila pilipes]|uniref:DUF4817 domain-containing protein n=1 Tax=Nephila pilipes TaxID=299642 RepID=A0A8X6MJ30_NEPPI|nr:DUF4817 domain-containing protein [Nephila pilipes]
MLWTTVRKILHKRLKLHPCKVQLLHELKPNDKTERFDFAVCIFNKIDEDDCYLKKVIFSNVTFHVSDYINRHNYRIWGTESPRAVREKARNSPKVNVWCALTVEEIFGSFFFIEQRVNSITNLDNLQCYAFPQIERRQPRVTFQEDSAPWHWGSIV